MTGKNLEIISQIVLWCENSFRIDWKMTGRLCRLTIMLSKAEHCKVNLMNVTLLISLQFYKSLVLILKGLYKELA